MRQRQQSSRTSHLFRSLDLCCVQPWFIIPHFTSHITANLWHFQMNSPLVPSISLGRYLTSQRLKRHLHRPGLRYKHTTMKPNLQLKIMSRRIRERLPSPRPRMYHSVRIVMRSPPSGIVQNVAQCVTSVGGNASRTSEIVQNMKGPHSGISKKSGEIGIRNLLTCVASSSAAP